MGQQHTDAAHHGDPTGGDDPTTADVPDQGSDTTQSPDTAISQATDSGDSAAPPAPNDTPGIGSSATPPPQTPPPAPTAPPAGGGGTGAGPAPAGGGQGQAMHTATQAARSGSADQAADAALQTVGRGSDNKAAQMAGNAVEKGIAGDGSNAAANTAGRYVGSAASGAIDGAPKGGVGAIVGAAKNTGAELGRDALKSAKNNSPVAQDASDLSDAGGTGATTGPGDSGGGGGGGAGRSASLTPDDDSDQTNTRDVALAAGASAAGAQAAYLAFLLTLLKMLKNLVFSVAAAVASLVSKVIGAVTALAAKLNPAPLVGKIAGATAALVTQISGGTITGTAAATISVLLMVMMGLGGFLFAGAILYTMLLWGWLTNVIDDAPAEQTCQVSGQMVASGAGTFTGSGVPAEAIPWIENAAGHSKRGIPAAFFAYIMDRESDFRPDTGTTADSNGGTRGLFQINAGIWHETTGGTWDNPNIDDPMVHTEWGAKYFDERLKGVQRMKRDHPDAAYAQLTDLEALMIAHNAGEGNLQNYPNIPDITKGYLAEFRQKFPGYGGGEPLPLDAPDQTTSGGATSFSTIGGQTSGSDPTIITTDQQSDATEDDVTASATGTNPFDQPDPGPNDEAYQKNLDQVPPEGWYVPTTDDESYAKPEVMNIAKQMSVMFGVREIGVYREPDGPNEHSTGRAIDFMVVTKKQGDDIARYLRAHYQQMHVSSIIWYQHIFTDQRSAEGWRLMEDRGSITQNHKDHVHVFFAEDVPMMNPIPNGSGSAISAMAGAEGDLAAACEGTTQVAALGSGQPTTPMKQGAYHVGAKFGDVGVWKRYHTGQDLPAPVGTPIYAPVGGVVAPSNGGGWAGTHVVIRHEDGSATLYAHMSAKTVQPGDTVNAGQQIGAVGMTGRTFGPHLHFEHYPDAKTVGDIYTTDDPAAWLKKMGVTL